MAKWINMSKLSLCLLTVEKVKLLSSAELQKVLFETFSHQHASSGFAKIKLSCIKTVLNKKNAE